MTCVSTENKHQKFILDNQQKLEILIQVENIDLKQNDSELSIHISTNSIFYSLNNLFTKRGLVAETLRHAEIGVSKITHLSWKSTTVSINYPLEEIPCAVNPQRD